MFNGKRTQTRKRHSLICQWSFKYAGSDWLSEHRWTAKQCMLGKLLIEAYWMFYFANFIPLKERMMRSNGVSCSQFVGIRMTHSRYNPFIYFTSFRWRIEVVKPMFLFKGCVISVDRLFCRVAVFLRCNVTDWTLASQILTERRSRRRNWPTPEHNEWAQSLPFEIIVVRIVWNILRKVQRDPTFNE